MILIKIPNYPCLIGNKVDLNYYADIFRYLYVSNNNLDITKYSYKINSIKSTKSRDNKKRDFRKKAKLYHLDENNILYKKRLVKEKIVDKNKKIIKQNNNEYFLMNIPETIDIIEYLYNLHKEDSHRGISSLRNYL